MSPRVVGRVAALFRYPVKSMGAESLQAAHVSWPGLAGDRRWAFVRPGLETSGFPWMTIRQRSDLWGYRTTFVDPDDPERSMVQVTTPAGRRLDVTDPRLAAELGEGVRVMRQSRGVFDWLPLSLASVQTVASLGAMVGRTLDPLRLRPNLLVDTGEADGFPEDAWVGATLTIGGLRMRVDERDERCAVINVDPATKQRDPAVLKAAGAQRQACLGVYGSVVGPGTVRVGDEVAITPDPSPAEPAEATP